MLQQWKNLSNTYKILLTMLLFIMLIQLITLLYVWRVESTILLQKERQNLNYQLKIDAKLLDNKMERFQKEIAFLATLEVMDDILTHDIDKRIAVLLEKKAKDLGEGIVLQVINSQQRSVASSIQASQDHHHYLTFEVPLNASFDSRREMGQLQLLYPLNNLHHLQVMNPQQQLWLTHPSYPEFVQHFSAQEHIVVAQNLQGKLQGWRLHLSYAKAHALSSIQQIERILLIAFLISGIAMLLVVWLLSKKQIELLHHTQEVLALKRTFLSTMSHELRTPLGSILNLTQHLIISPKVGDEEIEMLGRIESASEHLLSMINSLLQLSKLESNSMSIDPLPLHPNEVVAEMVEMVEPLIEEKGLSLKVSLLQENLPITSDLNLFKQVVINLLSNAIKFTEKGSIEVSLSQKGEAFELRIMDTGIGIDPSKQSELFCEFYQAHSTAIKHSTGLGLALSQKVAKLIHGTITIQSQGVGRGTVATFRFSSL